MLRTIEEHVLCHATVVRSRNITKPRNLGVCTFYSIGECVHCIHSLLYRYVLANAVTHNTSRRAAAGRLIALLVDLLRTVAWYSAGLRSFWTCTITHM